jgi:hypothetical protein
MISLTRSPDVNHTRDRKGHSHPYLTPLTGHELMAFFPPTNPATFEREPLSTSAYFGREESAFFARFNRKTVRGRMEIDLTCAPDEKNGHGIGKGREPAGNYSGPHAYQPLTTSSCQATHYPLFQGPPIPCPASSSQASPCDKSNMPPQPLPRFDRHGSQTVSNNLPCSNTNLEQCPPQILQDNPHKAWRYPMPQAKRRRAGKYTKRVIVRG